VEQVIIKQSNKVYGSNKHKPKVENSERKERENTKESVPKLT